MASKHVETISPYLKKYKCYYKKCSTSTSFKQNIFSKKKLKYFDTKMSPVLTQAAFIW